MGMKVIELHAENIKKLVAVTIRPDSNLVQITGRNGQGKTSTLDALWWAFSGTRQIQDQPIRAGAESALIKLDLGEIKITRTFARKEEGGYTTTLKVQALDGSRFDKPQDVLNALFGKLAFEPLAFLRASPEDQFDMVKAFVPGVDFVALANAHDADFKRRTEINRQAKEKRAQADGIALPPGSIPKKVDITALEKQLGDAAGINAAIAERAGSRLRAEDQAKGLEDRAAQKRAEAARLIEEAAADETRAASIREQLAGSEEGDPVDVTDLQARLASAREGNATADKAAQRDALNAEAQALEDQAKALTKAMDDREEAKQTAIADAAMPIPGLSFGAGVVLMGGQPFEQASDAEQLRASVAIAAAMNPGLSVIRVREGSLLDDQAMALLEDFANEKDMQIWIERVGGGPVGFELENGQLKADTEEAI